MKRKLLLFVIIICTMISNAQVQLNETKNSDQHFVKHINLITKSQEILNIESNPLFEKNFDETVGSEGALSNCISLNDELKSMDLYEIIEEYPAYPERTILFVLNTETDRINPGVLIDPKHILVGGPNYFDLVDAPEKLAFIPMNVYKSLDDLGHAFATDIYLFGTDPTDYQNHMALITLSRPLGAIIGWMGFGYNTVDSYYSQNTFYVTALESNEENELIFEKYTAQPDRIATNGFYFKPYHDFIAGAPFYNPSSAVHGIVSHWSSITVNDIKTMYDGATRITSEKYNTITSILQSDKPEEADIMPLKLSVEPGIINPSNDFNEFKFHLHNYSQSSFSGSVSIDIYLSTNDIIETTDSLLVSYKTGEITMAPLFSAHYVPVNKPDLPNSLKPGLYYLGAIINTDDADTSNNITPPAECAAVIILNPNSSNYISGKIITSGESSGEGYCILFSNNENKLGNLSDITTVGADLNFNFENIEDGSYIIVYVPANSNNHRNIPTYYVNTPFWQEAKVITVSGSDTLKNIEIDRIELPLLSGTKSISGQLSNNTLKTGNSNLDESFFDDVTLLLLNNPDISIEGSCNPDSEGSYTFNNLDNGTYNIVIDKPGFTQISSQEVSLSDSLENLEDIDFEFKSDSTIMTLSITNSEYFNENSCYIIYPNPVSGKLTIQTTNPNEQIQRLLIYSADGNLVSSTNEIKSDKVSFNTKNLQAGIYVIKLLTYKGVWTKTFIKK